MPIKLSLSGDGEVLDRVHAAAFAIGFRAFKVKVGLGLDSDLARVARARELVGPAGFLGVDANCGWTRGRARRAVAELSTYDIALVEQPVAADDLEGMLEIRALGLPVVADESVFGMADLRRVVRANAADLVSVYVGKAGGPGRAVDLGRVAGAFAGLTTELPSDIIGAHYYAEDIPAEPLASDGRRVRLTDAPGPGVEPRPDLVARFH